MMGKTNAISSGSVEKISPILIQSGLTGDSLIQSSSSHRFHYYSTLPTVFRSGEHVFNLDPIPSYIYEANVASPYFDISTNKAWLDYLNDLKLSNGVYYATLMIKGTDSPYRLSKYSSKDSSSSTSSKTYSYFITVDDSGIKHSNKYIYGGTKASAYTFDLYLIEFVKK